MSNHFIIRVGDGENFVKGSVYSTWGCRSTNKSCKPINKSFLSKVKEGDKLWFVRSKKKQDMTVGKIIAVATFVSKNKRETGPLISLTPDNETYGWKGGENYDIELHYTQLYNLSNCNLYTGQKGQQPIMDYETNKQSLLVNLHVEYEYIVKYSNVVKDKMVI